MDAVRDAANCVALHGTPGPAWEGTKASYVAEASGSLTHRRRHPDNHRRGAWGRHLRESTRPTLDGPRPRLKTGTDFIAQHGGLVRLAVGLRRPAEYAVGLRR